MSTAPRWRDALFLTAVALVLVAGLIHYGNRMADERAATREGGTSETPRAQTAAGIESAPPDERGGAARTGQPRSTCWDGRETTSLALCGLPDGARGLTWVFPSLSHSLDRCHRAQRAPAYAVVASFECFQQVMGRPVTVTYDQVVDVHEVDSWMESSFGIGHRIEMRGALGGRSVFKDGVGSPARISGMYARFPYVVSVFAPNRVVVEQAWRKLVDQRSPRWLRGVRQA